MISIFSFLVKYKFTWTKGWTFFTNKNIFYTNLKWIFIYNLLIKKIWNFRKNGKKIFLFCVKLSREFFDSKWNCHENFLFLCETVAGIFYPYMKLSREFFIPMWNCHRIFCSYAKLSLEFFDVKQPRKFFDLVWNCHGNFLSLCETVTGIFYPYVKLSREFFVPIRIGNSFYVFMAP